MKKLIYVLMLGLLVFGGCVSDDEKGQVEKPTASPAAGTYSETQNVTLLTKTGGASIYYTTNGTKPTVSSMKYMSSISITETTTLMVMAKKDDMDDSEMLTVNYVIESALEKIANVTVNVVEGIYTTAQAITMTTATAGTSIYYTTDGTTPTASSTLYTAEFTVSATTTLKAVAKKDGMDDSDVFTAVYTINVPAEVLEASILFSEYVECDGGNNKALEIYNITSENIVLRTGDTHNYFMMKLGNPAAGDTWASENADFYNFEDGDEIAAGDVFIVYNAGADDINITATGDMASTITYYNGNDDLALVKDVNNNGTYEADTDIVIDVIGQMDGTEWGKNTTFERKETVTTGTATFNLEEWNVLATNTFTGIGAFTGNVVTLPVRDPEFNVVSGTYTTAQAIVITTATTGASIYYTLDGTVPTATTTLYTGEVIISTTTTVSAIAMQDGLVSSKVVTVGYTIDAGAIPSFEESFLAEGYDTRGWAMTIEAGTKNWAFNSAGAKISAYMSAEDSNIAWLVSPELAIGDSSVMNFESAQGYLKEGTEFKLLVSEDYTGEVATANWVEVTIPKLAGSEDANWAFVASGEIALSTYKDKNIHMAFKYIGSGNSDLTTTYEIKNLVITAASKN